MKPPICQLCSKDFRENMEEGGLIYFQRTAENEQWHKQRREKGFTGHPPEAAWFCAAHFAAAREYSSLTLPEAIRKLKEQFAIDY